MGFHTATFALGESLESQSTQARRTLGEILIRRLGRGLVLAGLATENTVSGPDYALRRTVAGIVLGVAAFGAVKGAGEVGGYVSNRISRVPDCTEETQKHPVVSGDTMSAIVGEKVDPNHSADKRAIYDEIEDLNPGLGVGDLKPGQIIILPKKC